MSITKKEIEQLAILANLELSEEEKESYIKELNSILELVEQLNGLDTEGVEQTIYTLPTSNVFREDEVGETLSKEEVIQNAPDEKEGQFQVPRIL